MLCGAGNKQRRKSKDSTFEDLPTVIQNIFEKYQDFSDDFSREDLIALYNEFIAFTGSGQMTETGFLNIMRSLNVG